MSATPTSSSSTPQHWSTPQPQVSPAGSPLPSGSSASKTAAAKSSAAGHAGNDKKNTKGRNVFTNDGSFLERFQRSKKEEEEKRKVEEDVKRKREFDERFKRRGKRPPPDETASNPVDDPPLKRTKGDADAPLTQYEQEVKSYAGRSLKDDGIGVRPLVK